MIRRMRKYNHDNTNNTCYATLRHATGAVDLHKIVCHMFFLALLCYYLKLSDRLHDLVLSDEVLVLTSRKFFRLYKYWQQNFFNSFL